MRKVNWKLSEFGAYEEAKVGCVLMLCRRYVSKRKNGKPSWRARVCILGNCDIFKLGLMRKSIDKSKDDAIWIAREMLSDYQSCLDAELKKWE